MSDKQFSECLFPTTASKPVYKMPDYAHVHKELQRSGVTLNLLWPVYYDQCRAAGEINTQQSIQLLREWVVHLQLRQPQLRRKPLESERKQSTPTSGFKKNSSSAAVKRIF